MSSKLPLYVDMDGTLLATDTLHELLLRIIKKNPFTIFLFINWLSRSKAAFKEALSAAVTLDVSTLPYHADFLQFLQEEKASGRKIILATASNFRLAQSVADRFGIFTDVLSSDAHTNLTGKSKAAAIAQHAQGQPFAYAGNASVDLAVWKQAKQAIVVNASPAVIKKARQITDIEKIFPRKNISLAVLLKQIRIHQWVKNILLFIPLLASHNITALLPFGQAILAFLSFSFTASSIYLLNDLFDLDSDRSHATKKNRPIAAGTISILQGTWLMIMLCIAGIAISLLLPYEFMILLCMYFIANICYSFYLKRIPIIDVIILASLYTLRLLAGGAATNIETSSWLFVFGLFLFLSLALLKRYTEVASLKKQKKEKAHGRGYITGDEDLLSTLGMCSGYISLLILALYISSNDITHLYNHPFRLWLLLPIAMFWISRIWLLAHRGGMHEDPIVFAIKDKASYIVVIVAIVVTALAI